MLFSSKDNSNNFDYCQDAQIYIKWERDLVSFNIITPMYQFIHDLVNNLNFSSFMLTCVFENNDHRDRAYM